MDFLRSYLLACFGQVLNNLTSLIVFKPLVYFSAQFLEYELMFFYSFQILFKQYMTSMEQYFLRILLAATMKPRIKTDCLNLKEMVKLKEFGQGVVDK